jgi:3',5'-cyclic AMP phosphodiesterase CpdA
MFRLAHISDPHLGPLPEVRWRDLASKRVTGYVNWQRHRGKALASPALSQIMADLAAQRPEHLAVTGDLVNLGLDAEVENARLWLESHGAPADISVVPGNHDAYVPGALAKACKSWRAFMSGDAAPKSAAPGDMFPYLRVREHVAVIGVSSAIATSPFLARGAFRSGQARKLAQILDECGQRRLFRVVLIHHPPVRGAAALHRRLFGIGLFQRTVAEHGAELVLHGHTHQPTVHFIEGPDGKIPVVGVSSTSQASGGHKPAAGYNLFEISGAPGTWRCGLQYRSMTEVSAVAANAVTTQLFPA